MSCHDLYGETYIVWNYLLLYITSPSYMIVEFSRMLAFRFVTIRLRLASPFFVYYINLSLSSWVVCCFASSSCSQAGMSNSLTSFVIIHIASNRMSSRTLKINIILRIDLFFRITFQRGRSKVGRTKPRGRKSPSPLHHHDTDIDTR